MKKVDTTEGRRLLYEAESSSSIAGASLTGWLWENADGLLAAAEEYNALRERIQIAEHTAGALAAECDGESDLAEFYRGKACGLRAALSFIDTALAVTGNQPEPDPTAGLPPDLVRVLRDPTIVSASERDREIRMADGRTLFEHIQEWRNAPSNTASADLPDAGDPQ